MSKDFKLVINYIKSYKSRSLAILFSFILGTALIIGVGTLSRSAQQANVDSIKRDSGSHHVRFREINKEQLDIIRENKDIKNLSITGSYGATDITEVLPMNISYAEVKYLTDDTELIKGRFPKDQNEVVIEEWVMTSLGLDISPNQEITLKLYEKEQPETFKIVGILKDRQREKQSGIIEMFLAFDETKASKFEAYVTFDENSDINTYINEIIEEAKLNKEENVRKNSMLIDVEKVNGSMDEETLSTTIFVSIFAGLVIYSIFNISIYQRIRDYGMLRAVGAQSSKIFKLIFEELLIISSVGIIVGILTGIVGAQIFNKFIGNIQIEGEIATSRFIMPWNIIIVSIIVTFGVVLLISLFTYLKVRKISPIEAIRSQLDSNKKIKNSKLSIKKMSKFMYAPNTISAKNIFRNKRGFIVIMLSMSLGGFMFISTKYKDTEFRVRIENMEKDFYINGDFKIYVNGITASNMDLGNDEINYIENIDGIKEIKKANIAYSRMKLNKEKILDMDYFDNINSQEYYGEDSLKGLLVKDKISNDYILKQKLRGYDENMLNSLDEYLVSGEIDIEKMKNENLAVVYVPHPRAEKIVDINVGDTVKISIPQGQYDQLEFSRMEDDAEYKEVEFKVGAIVNYPYVDDAMYSGDHGVDVIISDNQYAKIMNDDTYNMLYADIKEGADHKAINNELSNIPKKVPGTIIQDITEEKEITEKGNQKFAMYNYGVMAVFFVISMVNLLNNISYNLTARTSEFGMLRAIGISTEEFKKMILFEGLFYGILSGIVVSVLSLLYQIHIYKTWDFAGSGLLFKVNYVDYLLVIIANIGMGILATYIPARKIKENSIVESINIIE